MSNYPYGQQPQYGQTPYGQPQPLSYGQPATSGRPTSVTVIAIIGIILASLALLCGGGGLVINLIAAGGGLPGQPKPSGTQTTYNVVTGLIILVWGVALLLGCIGALRMSPWARKFLVTLSIVDIAYVIVKNLIALLVVVPEQVRLIQAQMAQQQAAPPQGFMQGMTAGTYGAVVLVAILSLIYPIATLIVMRKPDVVSAFERGAGGAGYPPYGGNPPYGNPPAPPYGGYPQQ